MAEKKTYEIVVTDTKEIIQVIENTWEYVQKCVVELNKLDRGVFARKAENNPDLAPKRALSEVLEPGHHHIFVDAWTSGNPGLGGCRGVDATKKVLFSMDSKLVHSNNFFEVFALVKGIEYATKIVKEYDGMDKWRKSIIIYSDSKTALAWITSGKHKATADQESITKLIEKARKVLREHNGYIEIEKWDTEKFGEIPADYGRK